MINDSMFSGIKACIFDMDGTLIDSLDIWTEIDNRFFARRGLKKPDDYEMKIAHMNFMEMAVMTHDTYGIKENPEEIANEWVRESIQAYQTTIPAKPGAKEFLDYLKQKGIRLSLATSNRRDLYEPCLTRLGMFSYFDCCMNVNDLHSTKAEPKIYLSLAEKMNARPEESIVFEDILLALKTAKTSGFKTCAVYDHRSYKDEAEIIRISDQYIQSYPEALLEIKR